MKKDWMRLIVLNNLKDIVKIFGTIFLNTYFFKITDGNIKIIFIYWIIYSSSNLLYRYLICKFINSNNVIKLYRISIIANFISVSILLILNHNIKKYIHIYSLLQSLTISMYYASYENIICNLNENTNFKKYFAIDNLLSNIISSLIPLTLGLLIEKYSYFISFIFLFIITVISLIFSLFLKNNKISCEPLNIQNYKKSIHNKRLYIKMIIQNFFDGFNTWGPMGVLTTLIIYSRFSSESFVGGINSLSNILGMIASILCIKYVNKSNFKKINLPIVIFVFLLTIPISFNMNSILICCYLILNNLCIVITDINGTALTYELMDKITIKENQNDYLWNIQLIFDFGRIFGYLIVLLVFSYSYNYLYLVFILFSLGFLIRSLIICNLNNEK